LRLDPKEFRARTWASSSCSSCSEWIKASSFLRAVKQDIEKPGHVCGGVGDGDSDLLSYNFVKEPERLGRSGMAQFGTKWPRHKNKSTRTTAPGAAAKDELAHGQFRCELTSERYEAGQVFARRRFGVQF
jgi:hypothetical protein